MFVGADRRAESLEYCALAGVTNWMILLFMLYSYACLRRAELVKKDYARFMTVRLQCKQSARCQDIYRQLHRAQLLGNLHDCTSVRRQGKEGVLIDRKKQQPHSYIITSSKSTANLSTNNTHFSLSIGPKTLHRTVSKFQAELTTSHKNPAFKLLPSARTLCLRYSAL